MEIYGNKEAVNRLSEYRANGRMPHSLLFFGDSGTGKRTLAFYTAMLYLCEKGGEAPCMKCLNCERTEKRIHPDVIYIDGEKTSVAQLREILKDSHGASVEGGIRVYILSEFQILNRECQNALLTYLEEPSDKVRFILTASNKNGILPTILSRTALITTYTLTAEESETALKKAGVSEEEAKKSALTCKGNLGQALKALENKNTGLYFAAVREYAEAVLKGDEYAALYTLSKLPQTKEDKREPVRVLITETAKLFHDALVAAEGGKASCGCDGGLSERLAKKYSLSLLNELCEITRRFSDIAANVYFNTKSASDAFTAGIFEKVKG